MPITPLPQFEADLAEHLEQKEREEYARLSAPKSIVVRFGKMKMIGEYPYKGDVKPGCGSKMVVRTHRGTEIGEMLTSTCPNAGCSKSVTRKEMLEYIDNSGGRQFPFNTKGRVLGLATVEDLNRHAACEQRSHELKMDARERAERLGLAMKVVDAEAIIGGEILTFFFTSEERVDFRELVKELAAEHGTRIEMRQVGARDEARLTADYERCGQYCCCKNFLKVLKPVTMKSAKVQKATLDPLKISGRCGRLMCCLRYEDQTYTELAKRLPRRKKRVSTPEGDGTVIDTQILTQLALVRLDAEDRDVAVPVEELGEPGERRPEPAAPAPRDASEPPRRSEADARGQETETGDRPRKKRRRRRRSKRSAGEGQEGAPRGGEPQREGGAGDRQSDPTPGERSEAGDGAPKKKRRRRRRRRKPRGDGGGPHGGDTPRSEGPSGES